MFGMQVTANILTVFSRKVPQYGKFLPLYDSSVFKIHEYDQIFKNSDSVKRYSQVLPILLESQITNSKKFMYTKLEFDPETETLKIVTLRPRGFKTQMFHIDNIIPWLYSDMTFSTSAPTSLKMPPFVDDEKVYFNRFTFENYFCESDGNWNQQTINHPKLSLEARVREKDWIDTYKII